MAMSFKYLLLAVWLISYASIQTLTDKDAHTGLVNHKLMDQARLAGVQDVALAAGSGVN